MTRSRLLLWLSQSLPVFCGVPQASQGGDTSVLLQTEHTGQLQVCIHCRPGCGKAVHPCVLPVLYLNCGESVCYENAK